VVAFASQHLRQDQPRDLMAMAFEEYHAYLFSTVNAFRAVSRRGHQQVRIAKESV
jgi:hypothetical protein